MEPEQRRERDRSTDAERDRLKGPRPRDGPRDGPTERPAERPAERPRELAGPQHASAGQKLRSGGRNDPESVLASANYFFFKCWNN